MKTKLLTTTLLAFICWSNNANAQTNVSGFISSNTNWTLAGSPYIITGNTILDSGFVLTIAPGVEVKFNTSKSLQINGALRAIGNSIDKIIFTSNQTTPAPGDWGYILFSDNSKDYDYTLFTGSVMEHCLVEYAGAIVLTGGVYDGAIRISRSFPFINFCEVRNNSITGIRFFEDPNGSPTLDVIKITNCNVHDNNSPFNGNQIAGGIGVSVNQAQAIISNNIITDNIGYEAGGIYCTANNPNSQITNNIIARNTSLSSGGGIGIVGSGNISYNLVYGNSASQGGGIFHYSNGGTISNNVLINNSASAEAGAIYMNTNYFWPANIQIINNTIIDNNSNSSCGIYCNDPQSSLVKFNTITRNSSRGGSANQRTFAINQYAANNSGFLFNNNNLYGNKGDTTFYEFANALPQANGNLNVNNCWWGTTSTAIIDSFIYDFLDNGANGVVDYTPFLSTPDTIAPVTPPVNIIKTDLGGGNIQITWNTNMETDLAGYKIYWGSPTGYSFANFVNVGNVNTYTLTGISITDTIAVTAYDNLMNGTNDQLDGNESWFTNAVGKPIVNFSASSTIVCPADTVFYSANTPETYSYASTTWSWTFAGGSPAVSNAKNPKVIYNTSGVYYVKLKVTNIAGSDSITYSNYIIVNQVSYGSISPTLCNTGNYTSPSGLYTWYSSGTYHDTIPNHLGCDSILTINLTLNYDSYAAIFPVGCNSYVSPSGNHIWISSGTYYDTIPNYLGCDSIINVSLTVYTMDTSVTLNGNMLTSNASGVTYQWLNCNNGFSAIPGENYQSYTPATSGNFAVEITQSTCIDTSSCYQVITVGINAFNQNKSTYIYPNPASDIITLNLGNTNNTELTLKIYSVLGELTKSETIRKNQQKINIGDLNNGIYMVEIKSENWTEKQKLIIQR